MGFVDSIKSLGKSWGVLVIIVLIVLFLIYKRYMKYVGTTSNQIVDTNTKTDRETELELQLAEAQEQLAELECESEYYSEESESDTEYESSEPDSEKESEKTIIFPKSTKKKCQAILTSGQRKGQVCDKTNCKAHTDTKKIEKMILPEETLSELIAEE